MKKQKPQTSKSTTVRKPKIQRIAKPPQAEEPAIVKEIASRVVEKLREEDEVIGHLTDHHVKWLLMFTYEWFKVRHADMVFDLHSKPKRIFIAPQRSDGEKLIHFKKLEWVKQRAMLKSKGIEKRLPRHLQIPAFEVKFCRVAPEGERTLNPPPKDMINDAAE